MLNDNSNTPRLNRQKLPTKSAIHYAQDLLKTWVERDIARATEAIKYFTSCAQDHADDAAEIENYAPEVAEISRQWQQYYLDKVVVIKADLDKLMTRLEAL